MGKKHKAKTKSRKKTATKRLRRTKGGKGKLVCYMSGTHHMRTKRSRKSKRRKKGKKLLSDPEINKLKKANID